MLRVGLTGGLGSGKSTVANRLAAHGALVLASDAIGRELMQPGQPVFHQIVAAFGPSVLLPSGLLNRPVLARLAFGQGQAAALNRIVHPAVIAREAELAAALAREHPAGVLVVESALLLETPHAGPDGWRARFDRILLVTAPDELKLARFVSRVLGPGPHTPEDLTAAKADGQRRLALQLPDADKLPLADFVLDNQGSLPQLQADTDALWPTLAQLATNPAS